MGLNEGRTRRTMAAALLALIVALLIAILLAGSVAEAKPGGGGKPSGSVSKPSNTSSTRKASGEKGLPPGVANPASPYYNSPRYGLRHGALSNFFLWSWFFHDRDGDEYEEEYVQANYGSGGWVVTAVGLLALVGFPIWLFRRRTKG